MPLAQENNSHEINKLAFKTCETYLRKKKQTLCTILRKITMLRTVFF